jgi:hypothetical protein
MGDTMYTHIFENNDLQAFADFYDDIRVSARVDFGGTMTTTGDHPVYGSIVATQNVLGVIVCSDAPLCATDLARVAA